MLNFFRTRANSIYIKVLMAFLVFTFALWGVGDMLRNTNIELALQVGDQHIDQFKWQKLYQSQLAIVSEQIGRVPTKEEIKQLGIDKFIVNSTIDRLLYLEEASHMNLLVSDEMAKMEIASMPHFQRDGKFNKDIFTTILRQSGHTEASFLQSIKEELTIRSLITAITINKTMPDAYIDTFLKALAHKRSGKIYELSSDNIVISEQPNEEELEKLYQATKSNYSIPEQRQLDFLTFNMADVKSPDTVSDGELKALYDSRVAMYNLPESRSVLQLLFKDEAKAKEAFAMLQNGAPFNEVGKKYFPEKTSFVFADKVLENTLEKDMNDIIFKAAVGKASAPFQTDFGWHIFMVNSITPKHIKTFEEVKNDLKKSFLDEKKYEQLSELAQKIDKEVSMGDDLNAIAEKHNLKVQAIAGYNKRNLSTEHSISNNNTFMQLAFSTELGATSAVTPYKGQEEFFVLRVKNIVPESFRSKDEVMPHLKTAWLHQQRQQVFVDLANKFQKSINGGSFSKELAKELALKEIPFEVSYVKPNQSISPEMFTEIYKLKAGQTTLSLPVSGKLQIAFLEKAESVDTANMKSEREKVKAQLMQDAPEEMLEQYLNSLREKYKIVINTQLLDVNG